MKYTLTESELRKMIRESVNGVLNESCWYGSTKPFEDIIRAASKICDNFDHVNGDDYEPWDDCDGPDLDPQIYRWAERVKDEAEYWLQENSSYGSINGGEDW